MDSIEARKLVKNAFKSGNKEHLAEAIQEYYKSVNFYRKGFEVKTIEQVAEEVFEIPS